MLIVLYSVLLSLAKPQALTSPRCLARSLVKAWGPFPPNDGTTQGVLQRLRLPPAPSSTSTRSRLSGGRCRLEREEIRFPGNLRVLGSVCSSASLCAPKQFHGYLQIPDVYGQAHVPRMDAAVQASQNLPVPSIGAALQVPSIGAALQTCRGGALLHLGVCGGFMEGLPLLSETFHNVSQEFQGGV